MTKKQQVVVAELAKGIGRQIGNIRKTLNKICLAWYVDTPRDNKTTEVLIMQLEKTLRQLEDINRQLVK